MSNSGKSIRAVKAGGSAINGAVEKATRKALSSEVSNAIAARIDDRLPQIVDVLIEYALSGDLKAADILLSRRLPILKSEKAPVQFSLQGDTLSDRLESVMAAVANGELSIADGKTISEMLFLAKRISDDEGGEIVTQYQVIGGTGAI